MKPAHLVVFRFSAFGDVAIMLPVLRCVCAKYPELRITLVTRKLFAPVFYELPQVELLEIDPKGKHKGVKGLFRLFTEIRTTNPSGIVDLHAVLRTQILRFFFAFTTIRYAQIDKGRSEKKKLTRAKNKVFKPLTPSIHRYVEVFRKMGFPVDLNHHEYPPQPLLPAAFEKYLPKENKKWIGIAPFASFEGKKYPLDLMQQVVGYLQQHHKVFLFGAGKAEAEQTQIWEKAYPGVVSLVGKQSLKEELDFIAHLDVMLSMDSSNAHLATNYKVPVITLWGTTHPYAGFAAWGQPEENNLLSDRRTYPQIPTSIYGNKYPEGYEKAFRTITPKKVIEAVLAQLT